MRRRLRLAGVGGWLLIATATTYVVFTAWLVGATCGRAARDTAQARLCGGGDSGASLVVLAAVVVSIFVPALLLVRLWRRIGAWALLPVVAATVAVPVLATYALDLAPG